MGTGHWAAGMLRLGTVWAICVAFPKPVGCFWPPHLPVSLVTCHHVPKYFRLLDGASLLSLLLPSEHAQLYQCCSLLLGCLVLLVGFSVCHNNNIDDIYPLRLEFLVLLRQSSPVNQHPV